MYVVPVTIATSPIEGKGVFAAAPIQEGAVTWKYDPTRDNVMSPEMFDTLPKREKDALLRIAYLSPTTKRWVYPPENDPSLYTNHSQSNNQTVVIDTSVSEEPYFVANRDIAQGEELTVNYAEFDARPRDLLEEWV